MKANSNHAAGAATTAGGTAAVPAITSAIFSAAPVFSSASVVIAATMVSETVGGAVASLATAASVVLSFEVPIWL